MAEKEKRGFLLRQRLEIDKDGGVLPEEIREADGGCPIGDRAAAGRGEKATAGRGGGEVMKSRGCKLKLPLKNHRSTSFFTDPHLLPQT